MRQVPYLLRFFFFGLLLPLSFAPFHLPGLAFISLALFYAHLLTKKGSPFLNGLLYGLGFFGLGISWIYISIHEYGNFSPLIATVITFLLVLYLSFFTATMAVLFDYLITKMPSPLNGFLFAALWVISEYCRSTFLGGFPWLLIGVSQFDTPMNHLLPLLGIYGLSFLASFTATLLIPCVTIKSPPFQLKNYLPLFSLLACFLLPLALRNVSWTTQEQKPFSVAVLQENLNMRDKWDEALFWDLLERYSQKTMSLLGTHMIVMPESAIPVPSNYIQDSLLLLHNQAKAMGTAILLGILQPTPYREDTYYNSLLGLGLAKGSYFKQHLVPFGEYNPKPFLSVMNYLNIPDPGVRSGKEVQPLVKVHKHPIATLICYELAYPALLRKQLPQAQWIVSISDDGWFGHSLAMYQQQQMAQVLSALVGRYQIMANNDGLSSIIDDKGKILSSLPAFAEGQLKGFLYPVSGITPWVIYGDLPALTTSLLIIIACLLWRHRHLQLPLVGKVKRRYPYESQ